MMTSMNLRREGGGLSHPPSTSLRAAADAPIFAVLVMRCPELARQRGAEGGEGPRVLEEVARPRLPERAPVGRELLAELQRRGGRSFEDGGGASFHPPNLHEDLRGGQAATGEPRGAGEVGELDAALGQRWT